MRTDEERAYRGALWQDPCVYCGGKMKGLDHIVPASRKGWDGYENRAPACEGCDQMKGAAPLLFFLVLRRMAEVKADRRLYGQKQHRLAAVRMMTTQACIAVARGEDMPPWSQRKKKKPRHRHRA